MTVPSGQPRGHKGVLHVRLSPSCQGPCTSHSIRTKPSISNFGSPKRRCMSLLTGRRYALDSRAARDPHARLLGPLACTGYHLAKPLRVLVSKHENRLRKRRPACWVLPAMKFGLWGLQSSRGGATPLKTPEGPAVPPQHEGWLRSVVSAVAGVLVFAAGIALTVVAAKANPSVVSFHF